MTRNFILCMLVIAGLGIASCENTAKGFGKDMERAGQNIQNSVDQKESR